MKFQTLALAFSLSVFSIFSYAEDVTEGIVIEGESLPVGVALGDTFNQVEDALALVEEFDLLDGNDSYCRYTRCTYIARNTADEELGRVVVLFKRAAGEQNYTASQIRWTFDNWMTTAGLSLKTLRDVNSASELRDLYPDATRAIVRKRASSNVALLRSSKVGITMVSAEYKNRPNLRNVSYGYIVAPR